MQILFKFNEVILMYVWKVRREILSMKVAFEPLLSIFHKRKALQCNSIPGALAVTMHALKTRQGQDPQALGHYRLLEGSSLPVLKTDLRTNKDCFHWMSMHLFFKIYRLVVISQIQFCSVQSLSRVRLLATPWTAAHQASLSITNSQSLLKLMSIESVMPSNQLILCHPLLLLPSLFPSIRVFSNESVLHIRWPNLLILFSYMH